MAASSPRRPQDIARENLRLGRLLEEAEARQTQAGRLSEALPSYLRSLVTFVRLEQDTLVVTVPDGTVAARLRMEQSQILERLRAAGGDFQWCYRFLIRIRPQARQRRTPKRKPKPISKENAGLLLQEARQTEDQGLSRVLENLARLAR